MTTMIKVREWKTKICGECEFISRQYPDGRYACENLSAMSNFETHMRHGSWTPAKWRPLYLVEDLSGIIEPNRRACMCFEFKKENK